MVKNRIRFFQNKTPLTFLIVFLKDFFCKILYLLHHKNIAKRIDRVFTETFVSTARKKVSIYHIYIAHQNFHKGIFTFVIKVKLIFTKT